MRTILVGIARMGSSRFPGKVLADLGGRPVLEWIVDAYYNAQLVDDVIIATTTDPRDDAIEAWCKKESVPCYRGSEDDVLRRFTDATKYMQADVAVRVTCDCPFIDPHVIDQVVALREATDAHYASNVDPPTWPDGLDCEAITMDVLEIANEEATSKLDRECVTTWIQRNRHRFPRQENLICPLPGMRHERWVLDTEDDYKLCQEIAEKAAIPSGEANRGWGWLGIKAFLDEHPSLRGINAHHPRNERYFAALASEPLPPRTFETSKRLLTRAEKTIPLAAQTFSKSRIQYPSESPLFVTHADGGYCFDVDGHRFVDLVGGLLPVILGHRDPDIDYAVRRQLNSGNCFSLSTELEAELSELLCRHIPCAEMVRFGKNGSDVTSAAVRLARAVTGRDYIISSGYHGWHDWAVASDSLRNNGVPDGIRQDIFSIEKITRFCYELVHEAPNIAAIIVEPETDAEYLRFLRQECDRIGALLIFDEVITGFRFDMGGAQKLYGVTPDLACFGKSMANGYPISALVGKREYMHTMERTSYSGTFFGDPVGLTAAIATIKKLEQDDVLPKIHKNQMLLWAEVECLKDALESDPGIKLYSRKELPRLSFRDNDIKTLFIQEMAQQGVLIIASHNLSYAHGENEIKRIVTAYEGVLPMLADAIKTNSVKDRIKGRSIPAHASIRSNL